MTKKPDPGPGALKHNPFAELSRLRAAAPPGPAAAPKAEPRHTARGVRFHLEMQGRSGKVATRITGLPPMNVEAIAGRLRRALGCSATVEGSEVLLGGSLAERASEWLTRAGDLSAIRDELPTPRPPLAPPAPVSERFRDEPDPAATRRANIRRGQRVAIVLKPDQGSGRLTEGLVREILTSAPTHPRGIKVRLESGEVGRVQIVLD